MSVAMTSDICTVAVVRNHSSAKRNEIHDHILVTWVALFSLQVTFSPLRIKDPWNAMFIVSKRLKPGTCLRKQI